jgi:hypothetical protein
MPFAAFEVLSRLTTDMDARARHASALQRWMPMRKALRVLTALLLLLTVAGVAFVWWSYIWLHSEISLLREPTT